MRATELPPQSKQRFQFGRFALNVNERVLARNGRQIRLAPKVFDTLVILVRNAGHIVRKEELIGQVWPDTFVEENNLDKNISVSEEGTWGQSRQVAFHHNGAKAGISLHR